MKKVRALFFLPVILFSCLLAWYLLFYIQAKDFSFGEHSFKFQAFHFILYAFILFIGLSFQWLLWGKSLADDLSLSLERVLSRDLWSYLPLLYLLFLPLITIHYLNSDDLLFRLRLFGLAILLAIFYLKMTAYNFQNRSGRSLFTRSLAAFSRWSPKKKLVVLFLISLLLYNTGSAVLIFRKSNFSGDEPHYLLITHSLLKDGDFDLSDNYANRDYDAFMRPPVSIQHHTAPGTEGRYSFHSPGVSLLMCPFYALGSLFNRTIFSLIVRFGMSLFGVLLGLQIFLFAQQEWEEDRTALQLWALYSFTSPIFFYAIHVYPELIVAFLSLTVFRLVRFQRPLKKQTLCLCGSLLAFFIWFHALKYLFLLIPLFLYTLWILIKEKKIREALLFFIGPFIGWSAIYFTFQFRVYESFSLSAISWRGAVSPQESLAYIGQLIRGIPFRFRWETLAGYFLDQRDGLLLYSPLYFFSFLGIIALLKHRGREFFLLFFLSAPYVVNSALLTQRTGYAPQSRPLVVVSWVLVILVGHFLVRNRKKIFAGLFSLASFFSFLFVTLLLSAPRALYQPTTEGEAEHAGLLFQKLSNLHFYLPQYLPSFLKTEDPRWPPNILWTAALAAFMAAYFFIKPHGYTLKYGHRVLLTLAGLGLFFSGFVFFPREIITYPQSATYPGGAKVEFYSYSRSARMVEPGAFELVESDRAYSLYFSSLREIEELILEFGSAMGTYEIELKYFDSVLFKGKTTEEIKSLRLSPVNSYRLGKKNLYNINIHLESDSNVSAAAFPYRMTITPVK